MTQEPSAHHQKALHEQVQAAQALAEGLRAENRRLHAALAVERAAKASEELQRVRRSYNLAQYRISRLLRIFDALDVPRPKPTDDQADFVSDELLDQLRRRLSSVQASPTPTKQKENAATPVRDTDGDVGMDDEADSSADAGIVPDRHLDAVDVGSAEPQQQQQRKPSEEPPDATATTTAPALNEQTGEPAQPQKPLSSSVLAESDTLPASIIDESNPAAECLRILIGATSIAVYQNPRRVKITMRNPDKHREASFWLAWKEESMEYTQDSLNMEDEVCPDFLKEYAIDFDLAQAPRFLLLVMGAVFDMNIEPKADPEPARESIESEPPQE